MSITVHDLRCLTVAVALISGWVAAAAHATDQFPPTVLRENKDGTWRLASEYLGGWRLVVVDASKRTRLSLSIEDVIPKGEYDKYVHETTAGPKWEDYALHYFVTIHDKPHFCVRTWWGRRILLNLAAARQVVDDDVQENLRSTEEAMVMKHLRAGVVLAKDKEFKYLYEINRTLAAIHWAGSMKLEKAAPQLKELEESDYVGSSSFVPMLDVEPGEINPTDHCVYELRRMAQLALRRMGIKPSGYPTTMIQGEPREKPQRKDKATPKRYDSRVGNADRITRDMQPKAVFNELGPPDYVERWGGRTVAWRYDMDAEPSFSLLVIINDQKVTSVERWKPRLWHGNDLIPAGVERHVFDADGSIINANDFRTHFGKGDRDEPQERGAFSK